MAKRIKPTGIDPTTCDRIYDEEESAFLKAIEDYRRKYRRPFPTFSEILKVAKSIGYVKVAPPTKARS